MRKRPEQWQQDVSARQRNTVFPDTVQNEARLWRNLKSGKQKLTIVQVIGIATMFLTLVVILWSEAADRFRFATSGSTFDRLVAAFGMWAILVRTIWGFLSPPALESPPSSAFWKIFRSSPLRLQRTIKTLAVSEIAGSLSGPILTKTGDSTSLRRLFAFLAKVNERFLDSSPTICRSPVVSTRFGWTMRVN